MADLAKAYTVCCSFTFSFFFMAQFILPFLSNH
jgi:hypothetical protein